MDRTRERFDRAFKLEAVKLVRERGVSAAQAARDLDVHENATTRSMRQGVMKPEQLEIERLRREVVRLKAERDILKKATAFFAKEST